MGFLNIIFVSFALSMDAFAVSVGKGASLKSINYPLAIKTAFFFGAFQGLMPLVGWFAGVNFEPFIEPIDHWIAFLLLFFIGTKMILDAFRDNDRDASQGIITTYDILILSVATSIDALAVGVSFAFLRINIFPISLTIGTITFIVCFLGVLIGKKLNDLFANYAQMIGGFILILIGLNILNEHTGIIYNLFY